MTILGTTVLASSTYIWGMCPPHCHLRTWNAPWFWGIAAYPYFVLYTTYMFNC